VLWLINLFITCRSAPYGAPKKGNRKFIRKLRSAVNTREIVSVLYLNNDPKQLGPPELYEVPGRFKKLREASRKKKTSGAPQQFRGAEL